MGKIVGMQGGEVKGVMIIERSEDLQGLLKGLYFVKKLLRVVDRFKYE